MHPDTELTDYHISYYSVLHAFAEGKIRKLIVTMPPQHGKSFGSTENLPAYILGRRPDTRIAIASYNSTMAQRFNKKVQRTMDSPKYRYVFPETQIAGASAGQGVKATRNSSEFDVHGKKGGLIAVGRGGTLTGNRVDVGIMDDLYKDMMEALSTTIQESTDDWYVSVFRTRLHNDSQQLATFTRWSETDQIGRILAKEPHFILTSLSQIPEVPQDVWVVVNFQAIKEDETTPIDPREQGEPLWISRHSLKRLNEIRSLSESVFQSLYQGNPQPREGLLYEYGFREYEMLPNEVGQQYKSVTDTASSGDNYTCSICYIETKTAMYVTDIVYTQKNTDYTIPKIAEMHRRNNTKRAIFEANNGGDQICKQVKNAAILEGFASCAFLVKHQGDNKEQRIRLAAPDAQNLVVFPKGWERRWPDFANQLKSHRYVAAFNKFDDAPDGVSYMVEYFGKRGGTAVAV